MKQLLFQIKDAVTLGRALEEIRAACAPACAGSVLLHVYCGYLCKVESWDCNAFAAQASFEINKVNY